MPNPTASQVHIDRALTNISVAFAQEQGFVGRQVFPVVPVAKQSDKYFIYDRADWLRSEAKVRAPATESAGGGYDITTGNYYCDIIAFHKDVDDKIAANSDDPLSPRADAARYATRKLTIKAEEDWQSAFFTAGVWGTDRAGVASGPTGTQFLRFDESGSDPIGEITGSGVDVEAATGYMPNFIVAQRNVTNAIKNNSDVLDRIKYTQTAVVTEQLLAAVLDVDAYFTASAVVNSANEGATESTDFIMGPDLLLGYRAPSPSLLTPTAGYTFVWEGLLGSSQGIVTSTFRMEHLKADRVEVEGAWDQKLVNADVAVFFEDAVS